MAIQFSSEALKAMGFIRVVGDSITARFHSIHVYSIRGVTIVDDQPICIRGTLKGAPFEVGIGRLLNTTCRALLDDDLTEDEPAWAKQHAAQPPYALIHVGPTDSFACSAPHIKEDESGITTFDAFEAAKQELLVKEELLMAPIMTALRCAFTTSEHDVRFTRLSREVFGLTAERKVVHDIRVHLNAEVSVSRSLAPADLQERTRRARALVGELNPKVAKFFRLAAEEQDRVRRFLYYFLAIEIDTHQTFQAIDHKAHMERLFAPEERIRGAANDFLNSHPERWTALTDRFAWCAICEWSQLSDADVAEFRRLKKVRNDIAHGNLAEPVEADVQAAERLAIKLQWGR